jgi:hypothetical protein
VGAGLKFGPADFSFASPTEQPTADRLYVHAEAYLGPLNTWTDLPTPGRRAPQGMDGPNDFGPHGQIYFGAEIIITFRYTYKIY